MFGKAKKLLRIQRYQDTDKLMRYFVAILRTKKRWLTVACRYFCLISDVQYRSGFRTKKGVSIMYTYVRVSIEYIRKPSLLDKKGQYQF